jgi:2-hydroxy-6-oxonona-2,4-dienedioate hydrolase
MEIELINKKVDLSNGERYFYRECGVGNNIILFLHGNLSTSLHWDIIFEELMLNYGNGNFRCIAPDLRGHGETTYKTPIKTIRDLSEDIKLFCNAIGLTMFYLVGWSTGGAVAMRFTLDHPEMVIKLILLSTASPAGQVILKTDNQGIPLAGQCIQSRAELGWSKGTALEVDIALKNKDLVYLRNAWN